MEKIRFDNLVIEITRNCNMKCRHCLRGPAQKINMCTKHIDTLLNKTDSISGITFSGGEPSLYPEIIEYFLNTCKRKKIPICYFYIATNTKVVTEAFLMVILKLYMYCDEKDMCSIDISGDQFHTINKSNAELLEGLKFTSRRKERDIDTLINEGNTKKNFNRGRTLKLYPINIENEFERDKYVASTIYLNCLGKVINNCDWSYKSQNLPDRIICDVKNMSYTAIKKYNKRLNFHK